MAEFDPYLKWLGIRSTERPPNHYRLLSIEQFESDPDVIRHAADRQMAYVQKCANGPHQALSQRILNELSAARICLLSPAKRAAYDQKLKAAAGGLPGTTDSAAGGTLDVSPQPNSYSERRAQGMPETTDVKQLLNATLSAIEPGDTYSARLRKKKKTSLAVPMIGGAIVLLVGVVTYQSTIRPVVKQMPTAAKQDRNKPAERPDKSSPPGQTADESVAASEKRTTAEAETDSEASSTVESVEQPSAETTVADTAMPTKDTASSGPATGEVAVATTGNVSSAPERAAGKIATTDKPAGKVENVNEPSTKKTKPAPARKSKTRIKEIEALEMTCAPFEVANAVRGESPEDSIDSDAGRSRVIGLVRDVAVSTKVCEQLALKWTEKITERTTIVSALSKKEAEMMISGANVKRLDDILVPMKDRPRYSNDPVTMQQEKLDEERNQSNEVFEARKKEITDGMTRINELTTSLQSQQSEWRQAWDQLNSHRRQWLGIARPLEKYGHAEFEAARSMIENWLEKDSLWLDAYCWAAICAYELGDYPAARDHLELAEKLCVGPYRNKRAVAQINATHGLVAVGLPQQRSKSDGLIVKAITDADKQTDWQTPFIAGRAAMELGRQDNKAKTFLSRAMSINSTSDGVVYWLGRLQTTSSDASIRDVAAGTKLLESLWSSSDKRSWRLSFALVQAYDADKRTDPAERQWQTTLTLAPADQHDELQKQRTK